MDAMAKDIATADTCFKGGREQHRAGELAAASVLYERALTLDPGHGPSLHMSGMLAFGLGDAGAAIARVERALRGGYRTATVLEHHGILQLQIGAAEGAVASLQEAAALDGEAGSIWFNLGVAQKRAGRLQLAAEAFGRAARLLGTAEAAHAWGLALQESNRPAEAACAYRQALSLDPRRADSALNAGVIAQQGGDVADAIALYREALAADPTLPAAGTNLAAALHEAGDAAAAVELFRSILAKQPTTPDALNGLGAALRSLGDDAGAEQAFAGALELDPFFGAASDNLTRLLMDHGRDGDALAVRRACTAAHPAQVEAWLDLARVLRQTGDHAGEADALATAIGCDPASAEAQHHRLGDAAQRRNDYPTAAAHYRQAAESAPGRAEPRLGLAVAALKAGEGTAALEACEAVLAADRFDQAAICYRALALRLLGRDAEANWLTDPKRLVSVLDLGDDMPDPASLAETLRKVKNRAYAPAGQSVRGGTQTQNELFAEAEPDIQAVRAALDRAIASWLKARPEDERHPFLAARPDRLRYQSWSVILKKDGHHVPHIHPSGCISGVLYVRVPPVDPAGGAACLEIGRPGIEVPLPAVPPLRLVRPRPGLLVLFPSYLWHGTRPFDGAGERITIAFDVLGAGRASREERWR